MTPRAQLEVPLQLEPSTGEHQLGPYTTLLKLGTSDSVDLYLARDATAPPSLALVTLKVLKARARERRAAETRLLAEAEIWKRLDHPGIVRLRGVVEHTGQCAIALDYVFGASLAETLRAARRSRRPLTVGAILWVGARIADALHFAHELTGPDGGPLGVVHRSVGPENILLGFDGRPKLADLGGPLSSRRESDGGENQELLKLAYLSPEQALGDAFDRRSDIFSLGVVLWEALTGHKLFRPTNRIEAAAMLAEHAAPPPSQKLQSLHASIDEIVLRALAREPKDRYPTARELADAIDRVLSQSRRRFDEATTAAELTIIFGEQLTERATLLEAARYNRARLGDLALLSEPPRVDAPAAKDDDPDLNDASDEGPFGDVGSSLVSSVVLEPATLSSAELYRDVPSLSPPEPGGASMPDTVVDPSASSATELHWADADDGNATSRSGHDFLDLSPAEPRALHLPDQLDQTPPRRIPLGAPKIDGESEDATRIDPTREPRKVPGPGQVATRITVHHERRVLPSLTWTALAWLSLALGIATVIWLLSL